MNPAGMSFHELLKFAAYETNPRKLRELVLELDKRYQQEESLNNGPQKALPQAKRAKAANG